MGLPAGGQAREGRQVLEQASFRAGSDRGAEREPDLPAIDRFLAARYRHYLDDIQHPEVLQPK